MLFIEYYNRKYIFVAYYLLFLEYYPNGFVLNSRFPS